MNIINKVDNLLSDKEFKIICFKNKVNINNYLEIIDFNSNTIKIKYQDGACIVNGNNLCVTKLLDNEILIEGTIISLNLS